MSKELIAALDALEKEAFDIVFMDAQMPVLDGCAATRLIREREAACQNSDMPPSANATHIPIVALTAHAMQGDKERFLEAGMDDYISKPFHPSALIEKIKKFI